MTTKWTPDMDDLLGTMFDLEVADELGLSRGTVLRRRQGLGIPALGLNLEILWSPQEAIKTLHSKFRYEVSQLKVELEQC